MAAFIFRLTTHTGNCGFNYFHDRHNLQLFPLGGEQGLMSHNNSFSTLDSREGPDQLIS